MSDLQLKDIFADQEPFKCIYILYGDKKQPEKYELTDFDGNKININALNGYQKGVVLNDCYAYFTGGRYHSETGEPCGVVEVKEEILWNNLLEKLRNT